MYKIVEIKERELENFKGKIIQVISREYKKEFYGFNYISCREYRFERILTCLVEVEE